MTARLSLRLIRLWRKIHVGPPWAEIPIESLWECKNKMSKTPKPSETPKNITPLSEPIRRSLNASWKEGIPGNIMLVRDLASGPGAIVYFDYSHRPYVFTDKELMKIVPLRQIQKFREGAVYILNTDTPKPETGV